MFKKLLVLIFTLCISINLHSTQVKKKNIILLIALPAESKGEFEKVRKKLNKTGKFFIDIKYISVGKVDAAYGATKIIYEYKNQGKKIDLIMNLGSAGGNDKNGAKIGDIVTCESFMQLDFDLTGFGDPFATNINELKLPDDLEPVLKSKHNLPIKFLSSKPCGAADTFTTTSDTKWSQDKNGSQVFAIDMESYAIAKVAGREAIPFVSIKYITDVTNSGNSVEDWKGELKENDMQKRLAEQIEKVAEIL